MEATLQENSNTPHVALYAGRYPY